MNLEGTKMIGEAAIVDMVVVAEEETIMVHLGVSRHRIGRQDVGFLVVNAVVVISTSRIKVSMQAAPVVAITIINILHILVLMAEVVVEVEVEVGINNKAEMNITSRVTVGIAVLSTTVMREKDMAIMVVTIGITVREQTMVEEEMNTTTLKVEEDHTEMMGKIKCRGIIAEVLQTKSKEGGMRMGMLPTKVERYKK